MSWNDPILRSTFSFLFSTFYSRKHEKVTIRKVMVGSWQRRNFLSARCFFLFFFHFFIRKEQKKAKLLINISIVKIVCKGTTLHIVLAKKNLCISCASSEKKSKWFVHWLHFATCIVVKRCRSIVCISKNTHSHVFKLSLRNLDSHWEHYVLSL